MMLKPVLEISNSSIANAMRNGEGLQLIYHSLAGYHFQQFLSEMLQDFGKGNHIEGSISPSCYQEHLMNFEAWKL